MLLKNTSPLSNTKLFKQISVRKSKMVLNLIKKLAMSMHVWASLYATQDQSEHPHDRNAKQIVICYQPGRCENGTTIAS